MSHIDFKLLRKNGAEICKEAKAAIRVSPENTDAVLRQTYAKLVADYSRLTRRDGAKYAFPVHLMSEMLKQIGDSQGYKTQPGIRDGILSHLLSTPFSATLFEDRKTQETPAGNSRLHGLGILTVACEHRDRELAHAAINAFSSTQGAKGRAFLAGLHNTQHSIWEIAECSGHTASHDQEALFVSHFSYLIGVRPNEELLQVLKDMDEASRQTALNNANLAYWAARGCDAKTADAVTVIQGAYPTECQKSLLTCNSDLTHHQYSIHIENFRRDRRDILKAKVATVESAAARLEHQHPEFVAKAEQSFVTSLFALRKVFVDYRRPKEQVSLKSVCTILETDCPEVIDLAKRLATKHCVALIEKKPAAVPDLVCLLGSDFVMHTGLQSTKPKTKRVVMDSIMEPGA